VKTAPGGKTQRDLCNYPVHKTGAPQKMGKGYHGNAGQHGAGWVPQAKVATQTKEIKEKKGGTRGKKKAEEMELAWTKNGRGSSEGGPAERQHCHGGCVHKKQTISQGTGGKGSRHLAPKLCKRPGPGTPQ